MVCLFRGEGFCRRTIGCSVCWTSTSGRFELDDKLIRCSSVGRRGEEICKLHELGRYLIGKKAKGMLFAETAVHCGLTTMWNSHSHISFELLLNLSNEGRLPLSSRLSQKLHRTTLDYDGTTHKYCRFATSNLVICSTKPCLRHLVGH